ncbi:hypothetical protein DFH06DRAFT_1151588 [Mycena polygramma]|nr:hypothetical protein DFH06DRAFT_1151588 [Mycena polygramma]
MSVNRLTSSPLFGGICWASLPLQDGTWISLAPDALGPSHAKFLAAVKQLDTAGYPADSPFDLDGAQFRVALGLESVMRHLIPPSKTYNNGSNIRGGGNGTGRHHSASATAGCQPKVQWNPPAIRLLVVHRWYSLFPSGTRRIQWHPPDPEWNEYPSIHDEHRQCPPGYTPSHWLLIDLILH